MKILYLGDSIDGVIVKVPSPSNAVDRIVSRPGRVKLKTMTLVCVASSLTLVGWNQDNVCPSLATCLPAG